MAFHGTFVFACCDSVLRCSLVFKIKLPPSSSEGSLSCSVHSLRSTLRINAVNITIIQTFSSLYACLFTFFFSEAERHNHSETKPSLTHWGFFGRVDDNKTTKRHLPNTGLLFHCCFLIIIFWPLWVDGSIL